MATSSFFYGGSSAPEQNTVDELIDALNAATAAADEDRVDAEQAAQQAAASAANATLSEQNAALQVQQGTALLSSTQAAANTAAASASNSAASANSAALSATNAANSASASAASASAAAISATEADASSDIAVAAATNPYVVAVGSDLAGSGWTYDFGLVTDAADPVGSGTTPGYIETVAENINDVTTVATNIGTIGSAVTAAADAAASASAAAASQSTAATSASNASSSATAAASSASTASTQAASATSSATAAAGSASAAATSATSAASSASSASSSASSATASATSASGSATTASSAATAATAAQAAAEAAYDNFDDRYLGSKTSAPTTDNDGNALVTGALYFNSTLGGMYVWSGSAWGIVGSNPDSVIGPASSTDNAIARFDGTTGKLVQNSLVTLDDTGKVNFNNIAYAYGMGLGISGLSVNDKIVVGGTDSGDFSTYLASDSSLGWSSSTNVSAAISDVRLYRDAADTLAQRRGTNPQTFRIYNTYTDGSNYERGGISWSSNNLLISTANAGTGSARDIVLTAASSQIISTGTLYSEGFQVGNTKQVLFSNGANYNQGLAAESGVDGVIRVTNGSTGLGILKASTLDIATLDLGVLS